MQVGDYELGRSLRDILICLKTVFKDNGPRENQYLFELPTLAFYKRLYYTLYTGEYSSYENVATEECWACLDIDIPVDIFNDWQIFMVGYNQESRIVYKGFSDDESLSKICLPSRGVEKFISDAYTDLSKIYQQEINN